MKYAISVIDRIVEIRNINLADVLDEEYQPNLNNSSKFIGFGNASDWIETCIKKKVPQFLNWYDNLLYIRFWDSKEEAEIYLKELLEKANKFYQTKDDPFHHLEKTKGDWKNFMFKVVDITEFKYVRDSTQHNVKSFDS